VTPERTELEAEREFLLRSLDDLDDERAAGNIDDGTYAVLHEDYTARAAAVIRALDGSARATGPGAPATDTGARSPTRLRALTVVGIVVFCGLGAVLLAKAIGPRNPGGTMTGNDAVGSRTAVTADPNSYEGRIGAARAALQQQQYAAAVEQFSAASSLDPSQPEPFAYRGWAIALASRAADAETRPTLLKGAKADFDQALAVDPEYFDAYFFKGITLARFEGDPQAALAPLQQFLTRAPADHPMRDQVLQVLAEAQQAADSQSPTPQP